MSIVISKTSLPKLKIELMPTILNFRISMLNFYLKT